MKVWATMEVEMPLAAVPAHARRAERLGYDGLSVPEAIHSGIPVALLALEHSERLTVGAGILVAFARSPMLLAMEAWDLARLSGGRFEIGLGSQVRGNVTGRFGMPWAAPVPRMREYVEALRAIFTCWQEGGELRYEGEHYRLTRMQPFFRPGALDPPGPAGSSPGGISILLGAVNPKMTAVAGEVADAQMTHPTNSDPRYLAEVIEPALAAGAARRGRTRADVELMASPFIATGPDAESVASSRETIRSTLGFLYSTPAYRPTLELHGWQEAGERLHAMSRENRWDGMREVVTDAMLDELVPTGTYAEIPGVLARWYGGLAQRITFPVPADPAHDEAAAEAIAAVRAAAAPDAG